MTRVLFVCRSGCLRSPTFSEWFNKNTKHEAKFAAVEKVPYDENHVTQEKLDWAELVVVMETWHARKIKKDFPDFKKSIIVLNILDDYGRGDDYLMGRAEKLSKTMEG